MQFPPAVLSVTRRLRALPPLAILAIGWGIGLAFHAWDVLWPEPGPDQVEAEMERLRRRSRHA